MTLRQSFWYRRIHCRDYTLQPQRPIDCVTKKGNMRTCATSRGDESCCYFILRRVSERILFCPLYCRRSNTKHANVLFRGAIKSIPIVCSVFRNIVTKGPITRWVLGKKAVSKCPESMTAVGVFLLP